MSTPEESIPRYSDEEVAAIAIYMNNLKESSSQPQKDIMDRYSRNMMHEVDDPKAVERNKFSP